MAAVVRIKRRLDENPQETLVLNCKRRKINGAEHEPESDDLSAVLRLAGTSQKEENVETILKKRRITPTGESSSELKEQFKKGPINNITDKNRSDHKESTKNSRYKVVNCFRKSLTDSDQVGSEEENNPVASTSQQVTVFDVETHSSPATNEISQQVDSQESDVHFEEQNYVYDFYYTSSDDFGEVDIGGYVSVCPLDDPLVFDDARDSRFEEYNSDNDSEDSNAENYWKNDYPDEEDMESIDEDDMTRAVRNLDIDDLLSSESDEDNFVYSREEEDFQQESTDEEFYFDKYGTSDLTYRDGGSSVPTDTFYSD